MCLYVEIGLPQEGPVDVDATRERVLADLAREKIVTDHRLVAWHSVVMDPAYVHITRKSLAETARVRERARDARRAFGRALRRLDVLLHRGQHRRDARARGDAPRF